MVNNDITRGRGIRCESRESDSKYRNGMPTQFKPKKKIYQNITLINYKNEGHHGHRNSEELGTAKLHSKRNHSVDVADCEKQAANKHVSHT